MSGFIIRSAAASRKAGAAPKPGEDALLELPDAGLFAIADGGSASTAALCLGAVRDQAQRFAAEGRRVGVAGTEGRLGLSRILEEAFAEANRAVLAGDDTMHPATSLLCLAVAGGLAYVGHVGGCRAYLLRRGKLSVLTMDHTLGMKKVARGDATWEEYDASPSRRLLTRALGSAAEVSVDVAELRLQPGDVLMLASDGLTSCVPADDMLALLQGSDPEEAAAELAEAAAGGADDATVLLVKVGTGGASRPGATQGLSTAASDEALLDALHGIFLFEALSQAELRMVSPYLNERTLRMGEVLFREGDPGDSFFVVVSGRLHVTRGDTFLVEVRAGDHVGELSLILEQPRTATVTSEDGSRLFELSRANFLEIVERRPDIGARICLACLRVMAARLSETTDRLGLLEAAQFGTLPPS